jgi:hypothetical protein
MSTCNTCGGTFPSFPDNPDDELVFEDVDEEERKLDFELVFKERETIVYLVKGLSDPERGLWWGLDLLVQAMNVARVTQHEVKNGVTAKEVTEARLSGRKLHSMQSHGKRTARMNKAVVGLDRQLAKLIEFRDKFKCLTWGK